MRVDSRTIQCPPASLNINVSGSSEIDVSVKLGSVLFSEITLPVYYYGEILKQTFKKINLPNYSI